MGTKDFSDLGACYVNCTLKKSPDTSRIQGLMDVSIKIMETEGVKVNKIRLVDYLAKTPGTAIMLTDI